MLFEDLYDSVLRRYRVSSAKVEEGRQIVRGTLYELLEGAGTEREGKARKAEEENSKRKRPSE